MNSATSIRAIGLTGGIASGKSFASDTLGRLGAAVIDTDVLARQVLAPGSEGLAAVRTQFGTGIFDAAGLLDRRALRELIFAEPSARAQLEAITHPRIRAAVTSALQELTTTAQQAPYALVVVPLMAEKGRYPFLQSIIVVDCPESLQLDRLMRRDGISMMLAVQMLQAQANRAQRLAIADHLLSNDGSQAELTRSCERLHAYLLRQNSLHSAHV